MKPRSELPGLYRKKSSNRYRRSKNRIKRSRPFQILPSIRSLNRITLLSVFIMMMMLFFIFCHDLMVQCRFFAADVIEIQGLQHLTPDAVKNMTRIHAGTNTLSINLNRVRKKLVAHPWIREAEITRGLPATIIITIQEQSALATVDFGEKYLMNPAGEVFKKLTPADTPRLPTDLPVISGLDAHDLDLDGRFQNDSHHAVMDILELGRKSLSILPVRLLEHIHVDDNIGISLSVKESAELYFLRKIVLGFDRYPEKYKKLEKIISYIRTNGLNMHEKPSQLESIDLNHINRVVVRPCRNFTPHPGTKEV